MIIFDEKFHAENLIKNGYKNNKYIGFDNIILVKYWHSLGLQEKEITNNLRQFMIEFQNLFNDNIIKYKIDKAIEVGLKYKLLTGVSVDILESEIEQIKSLEMIELQKMMFVFLLVWKFKGKPQRLRITNTDIMNLARVKVKNDVFWDYIYKITQTKMLSMVEYKNKSYYRINILEEGNVILHIEKFDNIIDNYLSLVEPEKYQNCEKCGDLIEQVNNRQKYCKSCWKEVERELKRNWKREYDKSRSLETP